MKNKGVFIYKVISVSFIFLILISMIIKATDVKSKIIMLPFLFCSISSMGQNMCMILEKKKFANIFHKSFVVAFLAFWFGILSYASYLFIKSNNYFSIIFTIPFWFVGFYIIRKVLFESNKKTVNESKKTRLNINKIVPSFLILIALIIGITYLFFGVRDTYKINQKTKGYLTTEGYFKDYSIYNIDEDGTTYKLTYQYEIDGEKHMISTDYGVNHIPENNSIRKVKYNPTNHSEAVLVGTNSNNFLIYFGAFFTLGGMVFILSALQIKGVFDNLKIDVIGTYIGFVFLIIGIGFVILQKGNYDSFTETIKAMKLWIAIPIMFIVVGISQIIKSTFGKLKNNC